VASITLGVADIVDTQGYGGYTIKARLRKVDGGGTPGGSDASVKAELLYDGSVIAESTTTTVSSAIFATVSWVLSTNVTEWFPSSPDVSLFSIKIIQQTSGRYVAMSAVQLQRTVFTKPSFGMASTYGASLLSWPLYGDLRVPFRKNRRLGFDVWLEGTPTSAATFRVKIGVPDNTNQYEGALSTVAHMHCGIGTTMNHTHNSDEETYKLTFLDGNWRPNGTVDDVFTFRPTDYDSDFGYRRSMSGAFSYVWLRWDTEIPAIQIATATYNGVTKNFLRYIPEDTGHAVKTTYHRANTATGDVYVYNAKPGGIWKADKPTTFVLEQPVQCSTTNSFTDVDFTDIADFPKTILVQIAIPPRLLTWIESDTWTCPDGVTSVQCKCYGAGGGSGGVNEDANTSTGGGGGGGYSHDLTLAVTPGQTYTITIGAGGTAGTLGGGNGGNGGFTEFFYGGSALVKANGGSGSVGASGGGIEPGAAGASTTGAVGVVKYAGGAGADAGTNGGGVMNGGGGGSSGRTAGAGSTATNSTGATATGGGAGGDGRVVSTGIDSESEDGVTPGGGAGGTAAFAAVGAAGKTGGGGMLTLYY
jgi:hypothetical protein